MRRLIPAILLIMSLLATAGSPARAAQTGPDDPPAPGSYDAALVAASMVSIRRLELPVPLEYYQAAQAVGMACVADCTDDVIFSLPTDSPRGLLYTANYPKIDLVPVDPAVPIAPPMGPYYVPHLNVRAADALYKFVKYVRYATGEQIHVAHTWRPFYSADTLGAGASQHQTGLSADLYLVGVDGESVRSVNELDDLHTIANRYGWVQAFNFEDPHFFYLDAVAPGYTVALRNRGVILNRNTYAVTNALIAAYQTLTGSIPPEIAAQLAD